MTVSELIQELSSFPKEMQVLVSNVAFTDDSIPVFEVSAISILQLEDDNQEILIIEFDDENFIDPSLISEN